MSVGGDCARPAGGGPLRGIADDESRGAGERALAEAIVSLMRQRQSLHGKPVALPIGVPLSFAQLKLLFHLPIDGSIPLGRYADTVGITPAALTQALGPVEEAGLLERTRSTQDRRVVEARITDRGREVLADIRRYFGKRWDEVFEGIDDDRLAAAAVVLERVSALFRLDD